LGKKEMENNPEIFAMYLPQFHQIKENSLWWGDGFTDWVSVKSGAPLFKGHQEPKVPLNDNYYDLSDYRNIAWQAGLAKKYGISGFGIYHYWFSSKQQLLTKPAELLLEHKEIDIKFFFAWDNSSWIRSWSKFMRHEKFINDWSPKLDTQKENTDGILAKLDYGNESDWEKHFFYLLPFFKDERYKKIFNKPIFVIWNNKDSVVLGEMMKCWNGLAQKNGFSGIVFISRFDPYNESNNFDFYFNYEPNFSMNINRNVFVKAKNYVNRRIFMNERLRMLDYRSVWKRSLKFAKHNKRSDVFYGAFARYDDTPRRGKKGTVVINDSSLKFEYYLAELINISKAQDKKMIFLTAWNEWGEGAYLEPDGLTKYDFLESVLNAQKSFKDD
jgi:hypothetical protein